MKQNIIRGCWQLATGHSHHQADIEPILDAIACGFDIFDCADIYLGVEELLGKAIQHTKEKIVVHTKFVPDLDRLQSIDRKYVENIIDRTRRRLQVDCIDLVQFHWWDLEIKNYLQVMDILFSLKEEGKIAKIGLTNVSTRYLQEFIGRFEISSVQAQVSLFDKRAQRGLNDLCQKHNIKVFAYGTLLGGFLHEDWLGKDPSGLECLPNRSLAKYKLLIDDACGWKEFQTRLQVLHQLAEKYQCSIASIALTAIKQHSWCDAIIVGLSPQHYAAQNRSLNHHVCLDESDLQQITSWTCHLFGDVYEEERNKQSCHARVMKYNLNS